MKRDPGRVHLELGGAYLFSSDPNEGRDQRGGTVATLGVRALPAMEFAARYQATFGSWTYLTTQPSAEGGGNGSVTAAERVHRADLGLRFDVLRSFDVPLRLEPYAGGIYYAIDSSVLSGQLAGGGGGLTVAYEPDPRFALELSGFAFAGADVGKPGRALYGGPTAAWNWSGGVSIGISESSRLNLRYLGEVLSREHTSRLTNGVMIAFDVAFGKTAPTASTANGNSSTSRIASARTASLPHPENDR